jgi:excisionase family DNA binding protein
MDETINTTTTETAVTADTLTESDLSELLGVTRCTLWRWRRLGKGPSATMIGGRQWRYDRREVEAWVSSGGFANRNRRAARKAEANGQAD